MAVLYFVRFTNRHDRLHLCLVLQLLKEHSSSAKYFILFYFAFFQVFSDRLMNIKHPRPNTGAVAIGTHSCLRNLSGLHCLKQRQTLNVRFYLPFFLQLPSSVFF